MKRAPLPLAGLLTTLAITLPVAAPLADDTVYVPPMRGAPTVRVGGGSRGDAQSDATLQLYAPAQIAYTATPSPTLYWSLSPGGGELDLVITEQRAPEPLLEMTLPANFAPGLQGIELGAHGIRLAPGVAYRWSVTYMPGSGGEQFASGMVQYQPRTAAGEGVEAVRELAGSGYWYDAFALAQQGAADPALAALAARLVVEAGVGGASDSP